MLRQMTCGEALVQLLEKYDVDTVFGIPGVHTLDIYRGLASRKIKHVQARHEQGAGFMADGYARTTGKPGVCILITGPGVTNAATALGQSFADSIPVLLISSTNASHTLGKGWGCLHEITDQQAVTAPLTALSATALSPEALPELIGQAFTIFACQRPRPVHISIPIDVLAMDTTGNWQARRTPSRPMPDDKAVSAAAKLLIEAERPAIYVGGGAIAAAETLTRIANYLQAGVITSNAGKGIVPDAHPLNLGCTIWRSPTQEYLSEADVVLAMGSELAETDSFIERLPINGKLIRVDIDASKINDLYPADIGIVADAASTAVALLDVLREQGSPANQKNTQARLDAVRQAVMNQLSGSEAQHVVALNAIRRALPDDTIIMGDMTQFVYSGSFAFPVNQARIWHYPAGFCTLGCALPNAIGAKLGQPERPVAVLVGDGGFMFTLQELITAVELQLALPIIIWNNNGFKQIKDDMLTRGIPPIGVQGMNPDFIMLAKAFGARGVRPKSVGELESAVADGLEANVPTIIELVEGDAWLI